MLQYLDSKKIMWPDYLGGEDIWILTVNGTQMWLYEPGHVEFSKDSKYYRHKFNKEGISYKLRVAIATGNLIWLHGTHKSGKNNLQIFTSGGSKRSCFYLRIKESVMVVILVIIKLSPLQIHTILIHSNYLIQEH